MKTDWLNSKMKLMTATTFLLLASGGVSAQESSASVPWENIVSPDDTAVFWVLVGIALLLLILIWIIAGVTKGLVSDKELWKNKWRKAASAIAVLIGMSSVLAAPSQALAQAADSSSALFPMSDGLFWILIIVVVFLAAVLLGMLINLSSLIRSLRTEEEQAAVEEKTIWEGALSEAVPISQEQDILMDHEYDGIRELDNKLPPWWLYMFYFTIGFGVVYIAYYQFSDGPTQLDEYKAEMALAEEQKAQFLEETGGNVDETNVTLLTDAASLANGEAKFQTLCVACHGKSGGSSQNPPGVGPNLTDEYWLHGGGIKNVFTTIKYGVPAKGMISWEAQLSPVQIQEVASYVLSLQGTNPENAKDPQGDLWKGDDKEEPAAGPTETTEVPVEEAATADVAE